MSTPPTVPIFSPDGQLGDVPYEQMHDAVKSGGKIAVHIQSPDGTSGYVPADRIHDAIQAGGKIVPLTGDEGQSPKQGFFGALGQDIAGVVKGIPQAAKQLGAVFDPGNPAALAPSVAAAQADQQRAAQGRGALYRTGALAATAAGANVQGMEQAAQQGDTGAVLGHAAAGVAPYAVPLAAGAAADVLKPKLAQAATTTARDMYQSALKPSTRLPAAKVARIVDTGLQEGIPISKAGALKINDLLSDLQDKVSQQIGAGQGKTIDPQAVASRVDQIRSKFTNQVNPEADLQAIQSAKDEFLRNNQQPIPAADAQSMKQGTYQQLGSKAYGEMKTATIEAQKSLARGLKEEIYQQFPELKGLNAQESKLYDFQPALEQAIKRIDNHQLMGIGTPLAGTAAKAVTGSNVMAGVAGVTKLVLDNPMVKSRIAIALSRAGRMTPATAQARVLALSSSLGQASAAGNSDLPDSQSSGK